MTGEYTCGRCLQALRQGIKARSYPIGLQSPANSSRRTSTFRSYGTQRSLLSKNPMLQAKRASSSASDPQDASYNAQSFLQRAPSGILEHSYERRSLLKPDNLFHPFSKSPSPEIRQRAAFIKQNAFCPHPSHQQTRLPVSPHDPETRKGPETSSLPPTYSHFECPDCGIPIYCSEGHWIDDFEAHLEICDTLRQINEDDHDLHSGRFFPEFSYPGLQDDACAVNMTNWDTLLYTRGYDAINNDRSMRQVTRMLTYPLTIGSVLHELSPYNVRKGGRLTVEGLKSVSGEFGSFVFPP